MIDNPNLNSPINLTLRNECKSIKAINLDVQAIKIQK